MITFDFVRGFLTCFIFTLETWVVAFGIWLIIKVAKWEEKSKINYKKSKK